jgi:DNA mismatch repair protein MutS2
MEKEAQRRSAELKREAQAAARAATAASHGTRASNPPLGSVRVVRDGKVIDVKREKVPADDIQPAKAPSRPIQKGDRVQLRSFGSTGIVDAISGETAEVRVGSVRLREKLENLDLLEKSEPPADKKRGYGLRASKGTDFQIRTETSNVDSELKLIGRTTDEAVEETDKFLDEAFLNGVNLLRIIHGHGTGALRRVIHQMLKDHPHVERFSQAPPEQGGAGATIVELKQ